MLHGYQREHAFTLVNSVTTYRPCLTDVKFKVQISKISYIDFKQEIAIVLRENCCRRYPTVDVFEEK